jgi:hypothetical protein
MRLRLKSTVEVSYRAAEEDQLAFAALALSFPPSFFVFTDETSLDERARSRKKGWGLPGEKVVVRGYFVRGQRYSTVLSLNEEGVVAARTTAGTWTMRGFEDYIIEAVVSRDLTSFICAPIAPITFFLMLLRPTRNSCSHLWL